MDIIEQISNTCDCSVEEAEEYLQNEVDYLLELAELDDLRTSDIEVACSNLGLEFDYSEYFINRLAI